MVGDQCRPVTSPKWLIYKERSVPSRPGKSLPKDLQTRRS
jgi:hypothetical protein